MSTVNWIGGNGDWSDAADWSSGIVPGPGNDVVISNTNSNITGPITVTFSTGSDMVGSLQTNEALFDMTGGALTTAGDDSFENGFAQSGGSFTILGAQTQLNGGFVQTAGTIYAPSATLTIDGDGSGAQSTVIDGSLTAAVLDLSGDIITIGASAILTVGELDISGTFETLATSLTQTGAYLQTEGTLNIEANSLTLSGPTALSSGAILGSGGAVKLAGANVATFDFIVTAGTETVSNTGTMTVYSELSLVARTGATLDFVNASGGVIDLLDGAPMGGAADNPPNIANAGVIDATSALQNGGIYGNLTNTGTLAIAGGDLVLDSVTNTLGGTIAGAGTLELAAGADSIAAAATLSVANLLLDGATVSVSGTHDYAGVLQQTGGTLGLSGGQLTLAGAALTGGVLAGSGTLTLETSATMTGYVAEGTVRIVNTGALSMGGQVRLGGAPGDSVSFSNLGIGTLSLQSGAMLFLGGTSSAGNRGTLISQGGTDTAILGAFTNTGTIAIDAGLLTLEGGRTSLGGTIRGAGTLELAATHTTLMAGLAFGTTDVQFGTGEYTSITATLAAAQTLAGAVIVTNSTLALGVQTLDLTGAATFAGALVTGSGGTLELRGATTISRNYGGPTSVSGALTVVDSGAVVVGNTLTLGTAATDSVTLDIAAGASLTLEGGAPIHSAGASTIVNDGLIASVVAGAGYESLIAPAIDNIGSIFVGQGGPTFFLGALTGSGTIDIGAFADGRFDAAASGGTVLLGSDAELGVTTGFADIIAGFALGNTIDSGLAYGTTNSLTYNAAKDTLSVSNGSATEVLQLQGSYSQNSFYLFDTAFPGDIGIGHS